MVTKAKRKESSGQSVGFAGYILLAYWIFFAIIHLTIDLFIDLYTDKDYSIAFWWAGAVALPLAACTSYLTRNSLFTGRYTDVVFSLIILGLYLGSAYFTTLKLDLLISAAVKPEKEQVFPVKTVRRIFSPKLGFIQTEVALAYPNQLVTFKGTRTSYFLLRPYQALRVKTGRSFLGSDYVTHISVHEQERWAARWAYVKDWFHRYYWLMIVLPLFFVFELIKDKYFPASPANTSITKRPFKIVLKRLLVIILTLFCLFMLVVLLFGLFG
ncbi:hypothetical protein ABDD95_00955 [Mucilaginibacter sp. PAMB04274]|uniref:hypothetical protein n=1 Tax=Mucilaginibacter sp. PAMB04274 TaxID=3138568 RepID=UPI0031F6BD0A